MPQVPVALPSEWQVPWNMLFLKNYQVSDRCPEMGSYWKHDQVSFLKLVHYLWSSFFLRGCLHTWQKLSPNVHRDGSMAWKLLLKKIISWIGVRSEEEHFEIKYFYTLVAYSKEMLLAEQWQTPASSHRPKFIRFSLSQSHLYLCWTILLSLKLLIGNKEISPTRGLSKPHTARCASPVAKCAPG